MFSFLRQWVLATPSVDARDAYIALVARARNPFFYETLNVPDTLDGRFELILAHLFLLQHRLFVEKSDQARVAEEFSRQLGEMFFEDMDRSLREIGVSDTGVRYRIKAMAKAYHGRLQVYTASIGDNEQLKTALARNLYGTVDDGSLNHLQIMADYFQQMSRELAQRSLDVIMAEPLPAMEHAA